MGKGKKQLSPIAQKYLDALKSAQPDAFRKTNEKEELLKKDITSPIWIRLKSLFKSIICLLFFTFFGYMLYSDIYDSLRLSTSGKETLATVTNYEYKTKYRRKRIRYYHYHDLSYDDHNKQIDLGRQYQIGTKFKVIYLSNAPNVLKFGDENSSFWELLKQDTGWFSLIFFSVGAIVFGISTIAHFINIIKGEEEENGD